MASIFQGVTTSPAREFIASCLQERNPTTILMPCAGRFAAVEALIGAGIPKDRIITSDIGLFSSVVGYLADPRHSIADLGIHITGEFPAQPVTGLGDEIDFGAQIMAVLAFSQISPKHLKGITERRELRRGWVAYHAGVAKKLKALVDNLAGIRYEIQDVWAVIDSADASTALYVHVPASKGGNDRQFGAAPIRWLNPAVAQFDYGMYPKLLTAIKDSGASAMVYAQRKVDPLPDGWHVVFGETISADRSDYVISSWDPMNRLAVQKIPVPIRPKFPVYCDEEITADSKLTIIKVEADVCLYYRDLFVHKLGSVQSTSYFLMLIDGRVVTAFGLRPDFLLQFRSEYIYETFGISKSSARYSRIGKLFMFCLTSGQTKKYFDAVFNFGVREPRGIQTTSITTHREGKTDRNVMKRVSCEPLEDGRFKLIYRGDFRNDTWADVMKAWHERWGGLRRHNDG